MPDKGFPYYTGGDGSGGAEVICTTVGAFAGACTALTTQVNDFLNSIPALNGSPSALRFAGGIIIGAIFGWLICRLILSDDMRGKGTTINVSAVSSYPHWIVIMFPLSLVTFVIGLISVLYIWLFGFSIIALVGSYLISLGMIGLYYVLGAAERYASR